MDPQTFMDIATNVTKLKMYPYFDIAHYMLMCMSVRDDLPAASSSSGGKNTSFGFSKACYSLCYFFKQVERPSQKYCSHVLGSDVKPSSQSSLCVLCLSDIVQETIER